MRYHLVGVAALRARGNTLQLSIPRAALGLTAAQMAFEFKWTDNVNAQADALNLYRNGDTAPNARFQFRYATTQMKN